ncbi:MAG TPA: chloride channel protein [Polyangiaceae bacterium]|nr:chloride channel protein [Polyangiaceae bacterium]
MIRSRRLAAFGQWLALGSAVGAACGVASGVFLLLLEWVTAIRNAHETVVYTLPLAGLAIGFVYDRWGKPIRGGNNLIIDTIHEDRAQVPLRMAPMVLAGTLLTHLFGGSAGREGTAIQMGGSLADALAHGLGRRINLPRSARRQLLVAGMAGGFGSVFGTPIAGTLFGLEVVVMGRMEYEALVPSLVSALVGDRVTRAMGVRHTPYPAAPLLLPTFLVLGKVVLMGAAMAAATTAFVELTHGLKRLFEARIPRLPLRMFAGGLAVVVLWKAIGTSDYLGLGVPTILRAFSDPALPSYVFAAKLVFTAVTLAAGFLGGEVTPLFFVGATLGSVLARVLDLPIAVGAGVGLAAVFGAAANTPIALSVMAVELLGANIFPYVVVGTVVAYLLSGHRGVYPSQRLDRRKSGQSLPSRLALRDYASTSIPPSALDSPRTVAPAAPASAPGPSGAVGVDGGETKP